MNPIIEIIEDKKLTQKEFAKKIGVTQQYVNKLTTNKVGLGGEILKKILIAFPNIDLNWVVARKGDMYIKDKNILEKDSDDTKSEKTTFKQDDEEVIMYIAKNWERLIKHPILSKFLESEIKDSAYKLKQEFLESDLLERIEVIEAFIGEQFAEKDIENRRIQKQKLLTKKK